MSERQVVNIQSRNIKETLRLGEIIGKSLNPGSIVGINGNLGAGKTVLVKGMAKGLGVEEEINSPTFVIVNCYEGRVPFYHFDLYRISSKDELLDIGYEELFFGEGIAAVEWADRVKEVFPEDAISIEIQTPESDQESMETTRKINFEGSKEWVLLFKSMAEQASLA